MEKTKLTEKDYNEFYKTMLYGNLSDPLKSAIKSAYRDVCRTITGFSKNPSHDEILSGAKNKMCSIVKELLNQNIDGQSSFDEWHKWACDSLIKCFKGQKFTYGQAQKWVNMTMKYLSMFDYKQVEKVYEFCHVPIDNYIIEIVGVKFDTAWSRVESYEKYLEFQELFRNKYKGIPLDNEFYMWINASKEKRNNGKE